MCSGCYAQTKEIPPKSPMLFSKRYCKTSGWSMTHRHRLFSSHGKDWHLGCWWADSNVAPSYYTYWTEVQFEEWSEISTRTVVQSLWWYSRPTARTGGRNWSHCFRCANRTREDGYTEEFSARWSNFSSTQASCRGHIGPVLSIMAISGDVPPVKPLSGSVAPDNAQSDSWAPVSALLDS